jgi:enoyl-CoA hydratase
VENSGLTISYVNENKVLIATLHRPPVNALTLQTCIGFREIVSEAKKNINISAIIIRSEGKVFCGGADIKALQSSTKQEVEQLRQEIRQATTDLSNCPVPIISVIQGGAVGAGAVFASCSDIIIATEEAFFSLPEINIGIIGGAKALSKILPQKTLRMMALTGKRIPATDIHRFGGIEEIVSKEDLLDTALRYAEEIANKGSIVVRKWKEALINTEDLNIEKGFELEHFYSHELSILSSKD